ncbi:MAG: tRNA pseudouridine(13) synthase TruD [Myxococcales bacterium]
MKIKQRPEDFVVREGYRFDDDPQGNVWVYRLDKQKVSTLQALERISKEFAVRRRALSVCGLKDKQGRTEQLVGVEGGALGVTEVVQTGDLRLKLLGRSAQPLSSDNITANRFEVTVRDLERADAQRIPESVQEVERVGIVNYFDSQRFGFLKHGQGFIGLKLLRGDFEGALRSYLATPSELDKSDDAKVKAFWRANWGNFRQHAPQEAGKKYAPILRVLRADPTDFRGAFLHIDQRTRMMTLFELQSFVWNEGVKRYLQRHVPAAELLGLRYQAGALVLPRALPREQRESLWRKTFPLLAPDSTFADEEIKAAALDALRAQGLTLDQLQVPDTRQLFFKHEERPLFVRPGKLRVNEPRPDELNRGKLKVNLSFTLPPGAYATLVVRRVLWFAAEGARPVLLQKPEPAERARDARVPGDTGRTEGRRLEVSARERVAAAPDVERRPAGEAPAAPRKKQGFRARQRARKEEKAQRRASTKPKPKARAAKRKR